MDALKRWECRECYKLYDYSDDAADCCPPNETYVCGKCARAYSAKDEADACCVESETQSPNDAAERTELEAREQIRLIG